jgi:hypothetical protein
LRELFVGGDGFTSEEPITYVSPLCPELVDGTAPRHGAPLQLELVDKGLVIGAHPYPVSGRPLKIGDLPAIEGPRPDIAGTTVRVFAGQPLTKYHPA